MSSYDFKQMQAFSEGARGENDLATMRNVLPGCVRVDLAPGVEYIAPLRHGAEVLIDANTRKRTVHALTKDRARLVVRRSSKTVGESLCRRSEAFAWLAERTHETRDSKGQPRFRSALSLANEDVKTGA